MSEQPGTGPEVPDDLSSLEELLKDQASIGGIPDETIKQLTLLHARWYQHWQESGFPEHRAFGLVEIMVNHAFGS